MATEQAAQWAEPNGHDTTESRAQRALHVATRALERARIGTARRIAAGAHRLAASTKSTLTPPVLRPHGDPAARPAYDANPAPAVPSEPVVALALPWVVAGAVSWLVFTSTLSWAQAAVAGTCLFALSTLSAMHSAQRHEARALREQLSELRLSLRVTQALLDVETTTDAEHLDDDQLDDARKSGTRRLPRQRNSRPKLG